MTVSTLQVGEPAPWFAAANIGSDRDSTAIDELAGTPIVLFIFGTAAHPGVIEALEAFSARHDLFDGERAIFIGATAAADSLPPDYQSAPRPGQYLLRDSGTIARIFGLETAEGGAVPPTVFILSPSLQILHIVPLTAADDFGARVISMLEAYLTNPPPVQSPPVLVVPRVFDREFCDRLVAMHEAAGGREIGVIESGGKAVGGQFDPTFRKRLDWYISDQGVLQQAQDLLVRRLLPMVYRAFQFRTTRIERYLVGCYDAATGGHFAPHRDNTAPPVAHRRFAVTINLNDGYEGGYLRFPEFGRQNYRAGPGDAVVFSCSLLHEVTPITRGRRYAFLSFIYDEQSQQLREEYARQAAAKQAAAASA